MTADLQGAFEATWPKGLVYKLYSSGISHGLPTTLKNFFTDRMSRNNINGYISEWFSTKIIFHKVQYLVQAFIQAILISGRWHIC